MVDRHPVRIRESAGAIPAVLTIATEQTESRAAANRSTGFDSPVASTDGRIGALIRFELGDGRKAVGVRLLYRPPWSVNLGGRGFAC